MITKMVEITLKRENIWPKNTKKHKIVIYGFGEAIGKLLLITK